MLSPELEQTEAEDSLDNLAGVKSIKIFFFGVSAIRFVLEKVFTWKAGRHKYKNIPIVRLSTRTQIICILRKSLGGLNL